MKGSITIAFTVVLLLIFSACRKDKNKLDYDTSRDFALAEHAFLDLFKITQKAVLLNSGSLKTSIDTCETVTIDTTEVFGFPKSVVIDFGPDNCADPYGAERNNTVIAVLSAAPDAPGTITRVTPSDFQLNGHTVSGTLEITYTGRDSENRRAYNLSIVQGKITSPNQQVIFFTGQQKVTWLAGENTPEFVWDDLLQVEGAASGTNASGRVFTASISTPLEFSYTCRWIQAGEVAVSPDEYKEQIINFNSSGDKNCDNLAQVKIGNKEHVIQLR